MGLEKHEMWSFRETSFTFDILLLRFIVIICPAEIIDIRGHKRPYEISETGNVQLSGNFSYH